ncbi:N-6 DNA methylase [Streptosporangium oxazolinicum]|uniref:site-specific DNA-methyltransferase (adenine-specific) n=1 Tax=Streptosporangium oxazolinicum TaxID=909287 RepID=A0ABP8BHT6_9ACTN
MSATVRNQVFSAVHSIGGLLPADMLVRISEGRDVKGSLPSDYRVVGSRSVRDDAERHWDYLKSVWKELRAKLPVAPEVEAPSDPTGLAVTQWLEPLFAELGFGDLTAVGAAGIPSDDGGKTFAVSHRWNHVPLHLAPWNAALDRRPGGAGTVPPQSLLQECLNRTEAHLWGVLTNGRQLRLLRDSNALATASYVEFDLEAIFDGELFSEFVLLYRLLHFTRFKVEEDAAPSACWLEKWRVEAIASGTRALDHHRDGVQKAITTLGTGFLKHPDNKALREDLDVDAFHAALLRLAYRLIFLFVTEDRDALHSPTASEEERRRYAAYFSSRRLRHQASRRRGTAHTDLYRTLRIVLDALGNEDGHRKLGLPGLGGLFDDTAADAPLHGLSLSNVHLLEAVRHLDRVRDADSARWRQVDYRNMGAEELGSIYESLLELVPKHSAVDRTFELVNRLGNDRKKTGSYYTPSSLIETLLDSTLDPVIDDAQKRGELKASAASEPDPAEAIVTELLSLTVCDPACGSGHFLVAAARRIAKRVAAVRERNPEPTLDAVRHALHEVIARCVYGVDLNPMAVELAKVSLWLEALEPGKPLGFLDAHIKHGNGLIGATPVLLRDGIPSKAFKAVEGDDVSYAKFLEKQNDKERAGQVRLFDVAEETKVANTAFAFGLRRIINAPSDTLEKVHRQAEDYRNWENSAEYVNAVHLADAWCAAFMWHKVKDAPPAVTHNVFRALQDPDATAASQVTHDEIMRLSQEYHFFHWYLAFPEVFTVPDDASGADVDPATGWAGGFSCVLGNPPWDKVDFKDQEYFSIVEPSIAVISGTARRIRIAEWAKENTEAGKRYRAERRKVKSTFLFASGSETYPLCAKGLTVKGVNSLQTDQLFTERFAYIAAPKGRFGCIIPTAIATGAGAQYLFSDFTRRGAIASLYDFENRKPLFVGVHSSYKFCLLSMTGKELREPAAKFAFFLEETADLDDAERIFALSPAEIALINPNTGTLPIFRTRQDADLTVSIYKSAPVLKRGADPDGNPWRISYKRLFDMTDDSEFFHTRQMLENGGWELSGNVFTRDRDRMLPLYEGRMGHQYLHRFSHSSGSQEVTLEELNDPNFVVLPEYWVAEDIVRQRLDKRGLKTGSALLGHRRVTRNTDERTSISAIIPWGAASYGWIISVGPEMAQLPLLEAVYNSFVYDYVLRNSLTQPSVPQSTSEQLPVPSPSVLSLHNLFITSRVIELTYTSYDISLFARDLGDTGAPFCWDDERRTVIRAELDALFFHLYSVSRNDAAYILDSFPIVKRKDEAKYGTYRTKDLVLAEYDRLAKSGVSLTVPLVDGENYTSTLTPPPGHGPRYSKQSTITTTTFRGAESASVIGEVREAARIDFEIWKEPPTSEVCPGTGHKGRLEFRNGWEDWYVHCPACGMTWTGGSDVIDPHKPLR